MRKYPVRRIGKSVSDYDDILIAEVINWERTHSVDVEALEWSVRARCVSMSIDRYLDLTHLLTTGATFNKTTHLLSHILPVMPS